MAQFLLLDPTGLVVNSVEIMLPVAGWPVPQAYSLVPQPGGIQIGQQQVNGTYQPLPPPIPPAPTIDQRVAALEATVTKLAAVSNVAVTPPKTG